MISAVLINDPVHLQLSRHQSDCTHVARDMSSHLRKLKYRFQFISSSKCISFVLSYLL